MLAVPTWVGYTWVMDNTHKPNTNRFPGYCTSCRTHVARGAGVYDGDLYCGEREPIQNPATGSWEWYCPRTIDAGRARMQSDEVLQQVAEREAQMEQMFATMRTAIPQLATEARVRSLAAVITKVCKRDATVEELTNDEVRNVRNELVRRRQARERRAVVAEYRANGVCHRCAGAGGSDNWSLTGWYCYRCEGTGREPQ